MALAREAAILSHELGNGRQRSAKASSGLLAPSFPWRARQLLRQLALLRSCASYKKGPPNALRRRSEELSKALERYDSRRKRALFPKNDFIELVAISLGVGNRDSIQ